jgi:micrococcal nuclease
MLLRENKWRYLCQCMIALCLAVPVSAAAATEHVQFIKAVVVDVIDGDTIKVKLDSGIRENVRLIGVDCPEVWENEKFARDMKRERRHSARELLKLGQRAKEFTQARCSPGDIVRLEPDVERRDRYGRLLAYVWIRNPLSAPELGGNRGWDMLNAELLRAGLATTMTIPPNVKHVELFNRLQKEAQDRKLGIWVR